MEDGSWYLWFVLLFLIGMSAFFSSSETALMALNKIRLKSMADEGVKNASKLQKLVDQPKKLLSAILLGNNIVNICATSIATSIALAISPQYGVSAATIIMTVVVLIFGEITPKTIAAQKSEQVAFRVVTLLSLIVKVLSPVVKIFEIITDGLAHLLGIREDENAPTVTEAELKTMVDVGHEEGLFETDEREMINNVFDFGDSKAKDVMTPRTDIISVSKDDTYQQVMQVFQEGQFSKLPVCGEDIDDIIGILYLKDLILVKEEGFAVTEHMREPYFTYETKEISKLLKEMRTNRITLAIVLDEYGGTGGLITVEDMVEEIVGEIADEFDEEEENFHQVKENEYLVDGIMRIDDVNEMLGTELQTDSAETIGGYITWLLGRFAKKGEVIRDHGLVFTVEEIEKNRIEQLRIQVQPQEMEA